MKLKFAANLNWLFKENETFQERYTVAAKAGFQAIETADPYHFPLEALVQCKESSKVEHVLMNGWPGMFPVKIKSHIYHLCC